MSVIPLEVSVIMPTYNDEAHLAEAIESILAQSLQDFEFIIIDDCSGDRTPEILDRYRHQDARIQVHTNSTNQGVARSLNSAIALAKGAFIARMDGDDIALRDRLAKQLAYLKAHPQVGVLGTQTVFIDENGQRSEQSFWPQPTGHNRLIWSLLYGCPICHPAVMMRTATLRSIGGYDPSYPNEDMKLWTQMTLTTRLANLEETLLLYRMSPKRHDQLQAYWESHIQKVGFEYAQAILQRPVAKPLIDTLVLLEKYNYTAFRGKLSLLKAVQIVTLLRRLAHRLKRENIFITDDMTAINQLLRAQSLKIIGIGIIQPFKRLFYQL